MNSFAVEKPQSMRSGRNSKLAFKVNPKKLRLRLLVMECSFRLDYNALIFRCSPTFSRTRIFSYRPSLLLKES